MGKQPTSSPSSSDKSLEVKLPIRKTHRRLSTAEKEKLFDMVIFKRYRMNEVNTKASNKSLTLIL